MDKKVFNFIDEHRAILLLAIVFIGLAATAPNFFNTYNITSILKGTSLNAVVAIGFTLIFIIGELDLSIGAMVMLGGMLTIGMEPDSGWAVALTAASLTGLFIGAINGILVAKVKIHSFIVTLGMMSIILGIMHLYSAGDSLSIENYDIADWLETDNIPLFPPLVAISVAIVFGSHFILTKTPWGKGFFAVGGNKETAWLAGLNKDRYIISAFGISGLMSSIAGGIFALSLSSMPASITLANNTLMAVLAATIIGGTLMSGGKGSIAKSFFAVLLLGTIFNGLSLFGFSYDIQIFVNGAILAIVVLYEAWNMNKHNMEKGQNPKLLS